MSPSNHETNAVNVICLWLYNDSVPQSHAPYFLQDPVNVQIMYVLDINKYTYIRICYSYIHLFTEANQYNEKRLKKKNTSSLKKCFETDCALAPTSCYRI